MPRIAPAPSPATPRVDDKTFFVEAIQRLCGSLDPAVAIGDFFAYIARFLPLKSFSLLACAPPGHPWPNQAMPVAMATATGVVRPAPAPTPPPEMAALALRLGLNTARSFTERLITDDNDDLLRFARLVYPGLAAPLFFLRLIKGDGVDDVVFGSAHFAGSAPFNEGQLRLMRGLEAPLCIAMGNLLQHQELEAIRAAVLDDNQRLRRRLQGLDSVDVIGAEHGLKAVMQKVRLVAPVDVPVLITGETGTGKEVIARALHELSSRRGGPFVAVNCGALPPTLIDSELFGHARGAFTGAAAAHKGYFERAHGGTLFLDEIGELPPEAQSRLLRVLETGEMDKVGGSAPVRLDIRLLAATNRVLPDMVAAGAFRKDLYFRLRVVGVDLPPLRERREDIPALTRFLLKRSAARFGVAVPPLAQGEPERLLAHDWPGNIRELQNRLEEALICSEGRPLRLHLPDPAGASGSALPPCASTSGSTSSESSTAGAPGENGAPGDPPPNCDEVLRAYFTRLLRASGGKVSGPAGAAAMAGLKESTFRFKCRRLGVIRPGK